MKESQRHPAVSPIGTTLLKNIWRVMFALATTPDLTCEMRNNDSQDVIGARRSSVCSSGCVRGSAIRTRTNETTEQNVMCHMVSVMGNSKPQTVRIHLRMDGEIAV